MDHKISKLGDLKQFDNLIGNKRKYMDSIKEYFSKIGDVRMPYVPNNKDYTRLVGHICSIFPGNDERVGTGTIILQLTDLKFVIITCAHNFV